MIEFIQSPFMVRALLTGALVGFLIPLLGNFIVPKKLSLLGDASSHFIFAGTTISFLLGFSTGALAYPMAVLAVFGILLTINSLKIAGDQALALFLALGSAIASVAISLGAKVNLNAVLFGSVLTVTVEDLIVAALITLFTASFIYVNYRKVLIFIVNEELARLRGVPVNLYQFLLAMVTGLAIVAGVKTVGVLLVTALLVIPVTTASLTASSMKKSLIISAVIGETSVLMGVMTSYYTPISPGAATVIILLIGLLVAVVFHRMGRVVSA